MHDHRRIIRRGRPALAVAVAATALTAAGCGGSDSGHDRAVKSDPLAQSVEGAGTLEKTPPSDRTTGGSATTTPSAPEPTGRVLATRDGQIDELPVRLEIVSLQRSGATAALNLRLAIPSSYGGSETASAQIVSTFDDGVSESDRDPGQAFDTIDGISLVDVTNRKRHLVARDARGTCVCDENLSSTFVEQGSPLLLSATFAAPPPDVDVMDVVIPKYGTFKDVPVS